MRSSSLVDIKFCVAITKDMRKYLNKKKYEHRTCLSCFELDKMAPLGTELVPLMQDAWSKEEIVQRRVIHDIKDADDHKANVTELIDFKYAYCKSKSVAENKSPFMSVVQVITGDDVACVRFTSQNMLRAIAFVAFDFAGMHCDALSVEDEWSYTIIKRAVRYVVKTAMRLGDANLFKHTMQEITTIPDVFEYVCMLVMFKIAKYVANRH